MSSAQAQGRLWGAAARDWAELAEPVQAPFFEAALDALGIESGTRLLDAGCGAGLALVLAARRGAAVAGLDASAGLLAVARERLPEADLREGDLEALPYEDDTFDAVTAFNSIQYAGNPTAALREIKRVARPGQRVAITTWGRPEQCEMRAVLAAIGSLLPPPPPGAGGAVRAGRAGRARGARRECRADGRARDRRPDAVHPSRLRDRGARRISRPALRVARSTRPASRQHARRSRRSAPRPFSRTGRSPSTTSSRS